MDYDVFISYSRKDKGIADKIVKAFEDAGISYFIDRQDISGGEKFFDVIAEAIMASKVFLFIASKNSYASTYVKKELSFAIEEKRDIIPYIIDQSALPKGLAMLTSDMNRRDIKVHPIETIVEDVLQKTGRTKEIEAIARKAEEKRIAEARRLAEEKKRKEEETRRNEEEKRKAELRKRQEEKRRLEEARKREAEERRRSEKEKKEQRKDTILNIIFIILTPILVPIYLAKEYWEEILTTVVILMSGLAILCYNHIINPKLLTHPIKVLSKPASITANVIKKDNGDMEITLGDVSLLMKHVKGGTFTMGCTSEQEDCNDNELPAHQVTLSDFYIGETEVTQALWELVMEDTRWKKFKGQNPTEFKSLFKNKDTYPVDNVTWNDGMAFIQKLNEITGLKFRLPTEAEWEYAARGGNKSKGYKYSGSDSIYEVAWLRLNSDGITHHVKTKKPNEIGLYDMSGNVSEWCRDLYLQNYYEVSPSYNPQGPDSTLHDWHVTRGGGWKDPSSISRVSMRFHGYKGRYEALIGFRLALDQ